MKKTVDDGNWYTCALGYFASACIGLGVILSIADTTRGGSALAAPLIATGFGIGMLWFAVKAINLQVARSTRVISLRLQELRRPQAAGLQGHETDKQA